MRSHRELHEAVFIVHQVIQWEPGERTRSWQLLEERPMNAVRRIVISASAKISAAKPWLQPDAIQLVTGFGGESIRSMNECAPCSPLNGPPKQCIGFSRA